MKRISTALGLTLAGLALLTTATAAEQLAVVTHNHVNVRGKPSLAGEVITQLQQNENVVILEEIAVTKPNPGEPPKWARIRMPSNTPVWVSAAYVDPAAKTVTASRLNLRAGPSELYSIVGRIEQGTEVKDIRTVDGWMEIETPPAAYAFVAAEFLQPAQESAPIAAAPPAEKPAQSEAAARETPPAEVKETPPAVPEAPPETPTVAQTPVAEEKPLEETGIPAIPPQTVETATPVTEESTNTVEVVPPEVVLEPAPVITITTNAQAEPPAIPASPPPSEPDTPKRVVRREGVVRSTLSIQAPTYFELLSLDTRKTINYLHSDDPGLRLKDFNGKKILVTGEEAIDPRWPRTPVLEIDTLEIVP